MLLYESKNFKKKKIFLKHEVKKKMQFSGLIYLFGILRIFVGSISWLSPSLAGLVFGLGLNVSGDVDFVSRLFGSREVALGVSLLYLVGKSDKKEVLKYVLWIGVYIDFIDFVAGLLSISTMSTTAIIVGVIGALFFSIYGLYIAKNLK